MLQGILDPYERKARLAPALLTLVPLLVLLVGVYGVELETPERLVGGLAVFGVFYAMASIARELGKRLEEPLFASWGGKPTTQVLRHRDTTLDPVTKARYHALLSQRLGVSFPIADEEARDPGSADQRYAAGAKWLLDKTRDKKAFPLLFKENVAYGFRRNCLGLKPYALLVAVASLVWVLVSIGAITGAGVRLNALAVASSGAWATIGAAAIALVVWVFFFTERTVRTAAFAYADMLLRACDSLRE